MFGDYFRSNLWIWSLKVLRLKILQWWKALLATRVSMLNFLEDILPPVAEFFSWNVLRYVLISSSGFSSTSRQVLFINSSKSILQFSWSSHRWNEIEAPLHPHLHGCIGFGYELVWEDVWSARSIIDSLFVSLWCSGFRLLNRLESTCCDPAVCQCLPINFHVRLLQIIVLCDKSMGAV